MASREGLRRRSLVCRENYHKPGTHGTMVVIYFSGAFFSPPLIHLIHPHKEGFSLLVIIITKETETSRVGA